MRLFTTEFTNSSQCFRSKSGTHKTVHLPHNTIIIYQNTIIIHCTKCTRVWIFIRRHVAGRPEYWAETSILIWLLAIRFMTKAKNSREISNRVMHRVENNIFQADICSITISETISVNLCSEMGSRCTLFLTSSVSTTGMLCISFLHERGLHEIKNENENNMLHFILCHPVQKRKESAFYKFHLLIKIGV